jgi:hypothetical protein
MNPETGELRALRNATLPAGFELVPRSLDLAARMKLGGNAVAHVNVRSSHPLAQWARAKKKRKAKIAAASRRRNRR